MKSHLIPAVKTACANAGALTGTEERLRCMHGFGLCLWRLGRFEEAERVFERMLWLNPSDTQGARFVIDQVRAKIAWEDYREKE